MNVLKDLIDGIHVLAQQVNLPDEYRNQDIISKSFVRLKEVLKKHEGGDKVIDSLNPLLHILAIAEKSN